MKRIYLKSKKHLDGWKKYLRATDSASKSPLLSPILSDLGVADGEAADVVLVRSHLTASIGRRLKTVDEAMLFLKDATSDAQGQARQDLGNMDRIAIPCVISDGSQDRDKDVVVPGGADLVEYKKNPVMLFGHEHDIPAIGNGFGTYVAGEEVRSIATFNPEEVDPFGYMIGRMYEEKIMRALSIGFIPKEWTFEAELGPMAMKYLTWELIEFSAVNVGSNRNSLTQARGVGINVQPAIAALSSMIDMGDAHAEEAWRLIAPRRAFSAPAFKEEVGKLATASFEGDMRAARDEARKAISGREDPKDEAVKGPDYHVEWMGVAVALGQSLGADEFAQAVRANTYGTTSKEQAERTKDAAASQACADDFMDKANVEQPEMEDDTAVDGGAIPAVDNSESAGDDAAPVQSVGADTPLDLARIMALAEQRLA